MADLSDEDRHLLEELTNIVKTELNTLKHDLREELRQELVQPLLRDVAKEVSKTCNNSNAEIVTYAGLRLQLGFLLDSCS